MTDKIVLHCFDVFLHCGLKQLQEKLWDVFVNLYAFKVSKCTTFLLHMIKESWP